MKFFQHSEKNIDINEKKDLIIRRKCDIIVW